MDTNLLDIKFARIGARLKVADRPARRNRTSGVISLDVQADRKGEFFEIVRQPGAEAEVAVLDVQPADRHLLLLVREGEREEQVPLRPRRAALVRRRHPRDRPGRHRPPGQGGAEARRGPDRPGPPGAPGRGPQPPQERRLPSARASGSSCPSPASPWTRSWSCRNEPLRRGNGGKPHWAEFCYRTGGETVYVCSRHPNGVTEAQYKGILAGNPKAKGWGWRAMRRNPGVYVRGRVRHADHATITLHGWHRVLMNTEGQSRAMRNVAFLD